MLEGLKDALEHVESILARENDETEGVEHLRPSHTPTRRTEKIRISAIMQSL